MQDAVTLAERFRENVGRAPFETSVGPIEETTSVGVAVVPGVDTPWELVQGCR